MPKNSGGSDQLIDTLHLSDEKWISLSRKLDQEVPDFVDQRKHPRLSYRKLSQVAVAIKPPEGKWVKYIVRSRNLSPGGIGFIHGAYLHIGSKCLIILKDCHSQVVCIEGRIKRCELIEAPAHDIGVQFNEQIDIDNFVRPDEGT